jgi:hypothetical protein
VSALLSELAAMRASDPGAKAVVFSSWGRLLRLAGAALSDAGLGHASLAGASPAEREAALHSFLHDPACAVLTVGGGGGACGVVAAVVVWMGGWGRGAKGRALLRLLLRVVTERCRKEGLEGSRAWHLQSSARVDLGADGCAPPPPTPLLIKVMMSTAGGAAGLTLTVATTAFILEPSLNPGVESQAAARIWRLGQVGGGRLRPPARLLPACAVVSDPGSE